MSYKKLFEGKIRVRRTDGREDILVGDTNLSMVLWGWDGYESVRITIEPAVPMTCDNCLANGEHEGEEECPYAFDPYNTNGDCLGEK